MEYLLRRKMKIITLITVCFILLSIRFWKPHALYSRCIERNLSSSRRHDTFPDMSCCSSVNITPSVCVDSKGYGKRACLDVVMTNLTRQRVAPDDPHLLTVLRRYMIDLPSPGIIKMSYKLFQTPQAKAVQRLTNGMKGGFFIECGALDGERSSNTLYLEQKLGWSGLLVEMDPSWYQQLRGKNRKSYSINSCLSPHQYPTKIDFKEHSMGQGKLIMDTRNKRSRATKSKIIHQVYCFPIYSMMLALNRTYVDYFSLDVEGLELDILQTIPFDKLHISIFTVEYIHGKGGAKAYTKFMESKGYYVHSTIHASKPEINFGANDLVFVKNGYNA